MSANINIAGEARGTFTGTGADIKVEVGYTPSQVELLNLTSGANATYPVVAASGNLEPMAAQTPADAVDYSAVEGGVIGDALSDGFVVKAAFAAYNTAPQVVQWIARR
jgi:hypothetical protein